MNDNIRAALATGKWLTRTAGFDKIALDKVLADLRLKYINAKTRASALRLGYLLRNLGHAYEPFKVCDYTSCLEWRKGAWYRWTLADGEPVEFRKLDPQPEAPVL